MDLLTEGGRRPRLVVVFQKSGELILVIEAGMEVLAHRSRVSFAGAVVQPLVVRVVESFLLHGPLEIPRDLGHEAEAWDSVAYSLNRWRPEWLRPAAPRAFENIRQHEHGHIAPHAVTLTRDLQECGAHRLLCRGIAVI